MLMLFVALPLSCFKDIGHKSVTVAFLVKHWTMGAGLTLPLLTNYNIQLFFPTSHDSKHSLV